MSRSIELVPDVCHDPESEGQEYGYCVFEDLPSASMVQRVPQEANMSVNKVNTSSADPETGMKLNIKHKGFASYGSWFISVNAYWVSCRLPCYKLAIHIM